MSIPKPLEDDITLTTLWLLLYDERSGPSAANHAIVCGSIVVISPSILFGNEIQEATELQQRAYIPLQQTQGCFGGVLYHSENTSTVEPAACAALTIGQKFSLHREVEDGVVPKTICAPVVLCSDVTKGNFDTQDNVRGPLPFQVFTKDVNAFLVAVENLGMVLLHSTEPFAEFPKAVVESVAAPCYAIKVSIHAKDVTNFSNAVQVGESFQWGLSGQSSPDTRVSAATIIHGALHSCSETSSVKVSIATTSSPMIHGHSISFIASFIQALTVSNDYVLCLSTKSDNQSSTDSVSKGANGVSVELTAQASLPQQAANLDRASTRGTQLEGLWTTHSPTRLLNKSSFIGLQNSKEGFKVPSSTI